MALHRLGALAAMLFLFLLHLTYFSIDTVNTAQTLYESQKTAREHHLDQSANLENYAYSSQNSIDQFPPFSSPSSYCTYSFILSSDDYFTCTAVALFSLLETNPQAGVVLFVADVVSRDLRNAIASSFPSVVVHDVDILLNPNPEQVVKSQRMKLNFTKWRIWQIDSETVVYMDSDFLILQNVDDLCDLSPPISAIANYDSSLKAYTEDTFNAGFLVIKPGAEKLVEMLDFSSTFKSRKGGDQAAINGFYRGQIAPLDHTRVATNANVWRDNHGSWDLRKIHSFHMTRDMNPCVSSYPYFDENMSLFLEGKLASDHPHYLWIRSYLNLRLRHPELVPFIRVSFRQ